MMFELRQNKETAIQNNEREKIDKTQPEIDMFTEKVNDVFSFEEADKIQNALKLMVELHIDQRDRPDNKPYIAHPLEIAADLIDKYKIKDHELIIAALLHDSVEDQSEKLASMQLERKGVGADVEKQTDVKEKTGLALLEIQELFGKRIEETVAQLSSPDFDLLVRENQDRGAVKTKNELYKEYIERTIKNSDVFVIKFADFARNALSLDDWPKDKKIKTLLGKYGPVIKEVFLPAFIGMDQSHPLYGVRDEMIKKMKEEYLKHYGPENN